MKQGSEAGFGQAIVNEASPDLSSHCQLSIVHSQFKSAVYAYYRSHSRSLPWRETYDPYRILVSEIMLQQTQVERVREKYAAFLEVFPDFAALGAAPLTEVLSLWQGLGYNRRAVSLHNCAKTVVERYGGTLPPCVEEMERLPGIGHYTARAVAAFSFGIPAAFIETNIRSVYIHHYFQDREGVKDSEIMPLVEQTLDVSDPRQWYYALMDYGAMLKKTHGNPNRKSAHHARQSPFQGSNRERRSMILKAVLAVPGVNGRGLAEMLQGYGERLKENLKQLEQEGFIRQEGGKYFIK